jgi:sugar phosphate isomerase/epimerase
MHETTGLRPRLQCSTGPLWAVDLEDALDAVAEAGFKEVELMVTRDPKTQSPDPPLRLAAERGLTISTIHGPFLVLTRSVWGLDPIEKIKRGVEMCRDVGATSLIVHPPYLWEREYARWLVHDCARFSTRAGVVIAVETMFPKWVAGRRLGIHRWLEPEVLLDASPTVVLDTSHLTVARQDIFKAYDLLLPKLVHIHLSNNAGDGRDGHLELEQGILAIDRFLEEVCRTSFAGAISLELSGSGYLERPKGLAKMLKRNRDYVEARLSEEPSPVREL